MRNAIAILLLLALSAPVLADKDAAAERDETVRKTLDDRKVTLNFDDTPLDDVLGFLRDITGLDIITDPAVDLTSTVNLRLKDIKLRSALDLVLASQEDLMYDVWRGTVFITVATDPLPAPPEAKLTEAARKLAAERKLTLNFPDVPLRDVILFMQDITGLNFAVAEGFNPNVSLRVKDIPLGDALDLICRLTGAKVEATGDVNVVKPR
jgi:type II secretory pathway component HofQ